MDLPAVQLLYLKEEQQSLKGHACGLIEVASLMEFPYCEARLRGAGPWGTFAEFVEWVLVNCGSPYSLCPAVEAVTSPAPELSQPLPTHCTEWTPASMHKTVKRTEQTIALEPKPHWESDQTTPCISVRQLVELGVWNESLPTLSSLRVSSSWPLQ